MTDEIATQLGTFALVPQIVDAVSVPVIAAGGIADARGIVAAFILGAAAVQIGTAYLFTPEARIAAAHRESPITDLAPTFPLADGALAPLRAANEGAGSGDFMSLWSGKLAALCRETTAGELTRRLASEALALLERGISKGRRG